ncbi:MAG: hypothetical protein ACREC5_02055, partial [Thermoplasmata archaeon]
PELRAPAFSAPFLWEFAVEVRSGRAREFLDRLARRRILGGTPLADPRPGRSEPLAAHYLTAATEFTDARAIRRYARAVGGQSPPPEATG